MGNKCFNCGNETSKEERGLTDGYNAYWFCNLDCEDEFIKNTTFDKDGIWTTYSSI